MYNKTVGEGIPLVRIPTVRRMYACMLCVNVKQNLCRPFASSGVILAIAATTKHNVCVYVCVYVHVSVSVCLSVCLAVCACLYVCVYVCIHTYVRMCVYIYLYIHIQTSKYTYIHECIYPAPPPPPPPHTGVSVRLCYLGPGNGYYYELN